MSIENSKSSSIDGQWIIDNENNEFKFGFLKSEDEKNTYKKIVEKLSLNKIKNELMFNGMLEAQLRSFVRDGITITRDQLIKDINKEVARQCISFDLDNEIASDISKNNTQSQYNTMAQVEQLKNNLDNIFGGETRNKSAVLEEQKPITPSVSIYQSSSIPREPAIENVGVPTTPESLIQQPTHSEQKNDEIREQMRQVQDQLVQTLEWAKQQPNETRMTFIGNLENLSDDVKRIIIQQMELRGEVIISSIDNIYQEGNYIVVDAKDNHGRFTGADFTLADFTKLVNQPSTNIKSEEILQQPTDSNNLTQKIKQEQQSKDSLINGIIEKMADAGEFSHIPLENLSRRVDAMNIVKKKLQEKSIDDLEIILNSYTNQDEKTESTGMHR